MRIYEILQTVCEEFAPLFGLSFAIFALKGFRLSHSERWKDGFWMHFIDIVLSSAVGALLIVGCCIIAIYVRPGLEEMLLIGLAIFLSVGGIPLIDSIMFRYFHVHLIEPGRERRHRDEEDE